MEERALEGMNKSKIVQSNHYNEPTVQGRRSFTPITNEDIKINNGTLQHDDRDCEDALRIGVLLIPLLIGLCANVLCLVLEWNRVKGVRRRQQLGTVRRGRLNDSQLQLTCTFIWIHKVFLASFGTNGVFCVVSLISTMSGYMTSSGQHMEANRLVTFGEDIAFEIECGMIMITIVVESLCLYKLAKYPGCYPNVLRFNKRWVFMTVVTSLSVFSSLLSVELLMFVHSSSSSERANSEWVHFDRGILSKLKVCLLSGLAVVVYCLSLFVHTNIPSLHKQQHTVEVFTLVEEAPSENSLDIECVNNNCAPLVEEDEITSVDTNQDQSIPAFCHSSFSDVTSSSHAHNTDQEPDLMRGESEMNGGSSNQQFDVKLRQKKVNNNERNSNTGDVICSAMLNSNLEIVSQPSSHPITEFSSKTSGHTDRFSLRTSEALYKLNTLLRSRFNLDTADMEEEEPPFENPQLCGNLQGISRPVNTVTSINTTVKLQLNPVASFVFVHVMQSILIFSHGLLHFVASLLLTSHDRGKDDDNSNNNGGQPTDCRERIDGKHVVVFLCQSVILLSLLLSKPLMYLKLHQKTTPH
ncbi:uncharacterized protein LOC142351816 [Convolutriloba macropyga]|uniref:uncharacterized protein LOC142351816 n=1 Tax=Convolutriloba macropyga TaxID=536237 RepID=UPI003F5275F2